MRAKVRAHSLSLFSLAVAFVLARWSAASEIRQRLPVFDFTDPAAAGRDWKPLDGSSPVTAAPEKTPDGTPALEFRCEMARLRERAYWDRTLEANLKTSSAVAFWVKAAGDPAAASHATLYFKADKGWYGAPVEVPFGQWKRVVLDRGSFTPEGSPDGWGNLRGVRVSVWKGSDGLVTAWVGGMEAISSSVVVVRNTRAGKDVGNFPQLMERILEGAGIHSVLVEDVDVEAGALEGRHLAIYPHNPKVSESEIGALESFARRGGRLLVCYSLPEKLADLLAIEVLGHLPRERPGQFARMRFLPGGPPGLPPEARQGSWNIMKVRPKTDATRVLAKWHDEEGNDTGHPAVLLGESGAYVSHVVLDEDLPAKESFLRAVLGHLRPEIWEELLGTAAARAGRISRWDGFEESEKGIRELAEGGSGKPAVGENLTLARQLLEKGLEARKETRHVEALDSLRKSREALLDAFVLAQKSRPWEFRAVWCHAARGVSGWTWDEAIRKLEESGFNAVVPNMLWGGVADYPSDVLPVRQGVSRASDPVGECVAAARKHGIEVHVWKVNWNLGGAPQDFVSRMKTEGRLQASRYGEEERWLCPSHPENFKLELDSMMEVVRKYDVDGIHFDYIRYPDASKCYCPGCRKRFEEGSGKPVAEWPRDVVLGGARHAAYQDFRRSSITRLVKAVSEEVRRLKPWVKVSAAVFSTWPQCREDIGQDWALWAREGYLDFVCPMNYTASNDAFRGRIRAEREALGGRVPLYSGIGAAAPGLPLDQVIDQVQIAREEGADGFIIFNYAGEVASAYVPSLGRAATAGATRAPHEAPVVEWKLRQGAEEVDGAAKAGAPVTVEATVTTRGRFRPGAAPREAEAAIFLVELGGGSARELGRVRSGQGPLRCEIQGEKGLFRLEARGSHTPAEGPSKEFLTRGPFLRWDGD